VKFRHYLVFVVKVRENKIIVRFIKQLKDEGVTGIEVNEESRRVFFTIPFHIVERIGGLVEEYASTAFYEIKAKAFHNLGYSQLRRLYSELVGKGFKNIRLFSPRGSYPRIMGFVEDHTPLFLEVYPRRGGRPGTVVIRVFKYTPQMPSVNLAIPRSLFEHEYKGLNETIEKMTKISGEILRVEEEIKELILKVTKTK